MIRQLSIAFVMMTLVLGLAQAGLAAEEEQKKAKAPELIVATLYADWCGTCKALDPRVKEVKEELSDKSVLFLTLDLTDEKSRQQAEMLVSLLGADEAWAEHGGRTGYAVLLKPESGEVVGRLTVQQDAEAMQASIREHIEG